MTSEAVAAPRRRRRWPWILAIVVVVVLVAAFFIVDAAGRAYARDLIAQKFSEALGVDPERLDVTLASTPLPIQLLDGKIDAVDIDAPSISFGPLAGSLSVHAADVPLDPSAATRTLDIGFRLDQAQLTALAKSFGGGAISSIQLKAPNAVASGSVSVFGVAVPLAVALEPSAVDGKLAFSATSITIAGQSYTADQLRATPGLGAVVEPLLAQQTFCIASYLPKAVTVDRVEVTGKRLVVRANGDGVVLGGSGLSKKGTCP